MRLRQRDPPRLTSQLRRPLSQLRLQVIPLVEQLTVRLWNPSRESPPGDLGRVEVVAATLGFVGEAGEKRGDRCKRISLRVKADELGVMAVPLSPSGEDFLGEQGFAPGGDQPLRVEEFVDARSKVAWG